MADNNQFTWDALNNILKYSGAAMTGMKKAADAGKLPTIDKNLTGEARDAAIKESFQNAFDSGQLDYNDFVPESPKPNASNDATIASKYQNKFSDIPLNGLLSVVPRSPWNSLSSTQQGKMADYLASDDNDDTGKNEEMSDAEKRQHKYAQQVMNANLELINKGVNPMFVTGQFGSGGWNANSKNSPIGEQPGFYTKDSNGNLAMLGLYTNGAGEELASFLSDEKGKASPGVQNQISRAYNDGAEMGYAIKRYDFNDDGSVTPDELEEADRIYEEDAKRRANDYGWTYDSDANGMYMFEDNDPRKLKVKSQYNNQGWIDSLYKYDPELEAMKYTLSGEDVNNDFDALEQAAYKQFYGLGGDYGNGIDYRKLFGDSYAAMQFADLSDPNVWAWWEYTQGEDSPVGEHFKYLRDMKNENGESIYGPEGYSFERYVDRINNPDEYDLSDPFYFKTLYGNVGPTINDVNKYIGENDTGFADFSSGTNPAQMYLDATTIPVERLDEYKNAADPKGRIALTVKNEDGTINDRALGLMNLMTLSSMFGEDYDDWVPTESTLNRFMEMAGLDNRYKVSPSGEASEEFDRYGAPENYRWPFRVYPWTEYDENTAMPVFDLGNFEGLAANEYAKAGYGLSRA